MPGTRWIVEGLALLLAGCGDMQMQDFVDGSPRMAPEEYFLGRTKAWGMFTDRFGRIRRQFQVDIVGEFDGETLILTEDFIYDDGERSRRIWRIRPKGDGRYEGRADDVIGVAEGQSLGNALHWRYDLNLPIGDRTWQVHFDDWMLRQDDVVAINRATVSKFGVTLGEVVIFFQRLDVSSNSVTSEPKPAGVKGEEASSPGARLRAA